MCSESCTNPANTCCLCCFLERPETLLKNKIHHRHQKIFQATYKDAQIRLTKADIIKAHICCSFSEVTTQRNSGKYVRVFQYFKELLFQSKTFVCFVISKNLKLLKE